MKSFINISVIGAGLMGHGIALKFAQFGKSITVYDTNLESLNSLPERIKSSMKQMKISDLEINKILKFIKVSSDLKKSVADADFVIEAIPEKLELKQKMFSSIEGFVSPKCIISSNTSVIPITKIVDNVKDKSRCLGTHWWNPPHLIPLVEVIKTRWTKEIVIKSVMELLKKIEKTPVRVEKDIPGFIGNRLQHALWREAISLVENNVCDAKSVDTVIKSSFGRRLAVLGPMENADLVGTDLTLDVHKNVLYDLENSKKPSKLLINLVKNGKLGVKSGQGFQNWTNNEIEKTKNRVSRYLSKIEKNNLIKE